MTVTVEPTVGRLLFNANRLHIPHRAQPTNGRLYRCIDHRAQPTNGRLYRCIDHRAQPTNGPLYGCIDHRAQPTNGRLYGCIDHRAQPTTVYGEAVLFRAATAAGLGWDADEAHSAVYDTEQTAKPFCTIAVAWPRP